ncbi:hypothetical protein HF850_01650 [Clostridium sp. SM-530-WT-3G]|nr:hypothetical protein [Clostridium sp. SM-530-WT-3G]
MKILIIKKKFLINLITFTIVTLIIIVALFLLCNKFNFQETLSPLNLSQNYSYDLNGDGLQDNIQLVEEQNKVDICIKCANEEYYLSKECTDKVLFTSCSYLKPKIFIHDLSRNSVPEIILTGLKGEKNSAYVFQWNKNKFTLLYSDNNNIFGILNCKNSCTPQCYSLNSIKGLSSLNSFMVINNSILDTTADSKSLPSLDSVTSFINIIELSYPLDELPSIFSSNINSDELSLLWNLDKDNNSYLFQNGFFYDYEWDNLNSPLYIKWRLSFEKKSLKDNNSDKKQLVLLIDLRKESNSSSYNITSIQVSN